VYCHQHCPRLHLCFATAHYGTAGRSISRSRIHGIFGSHAAANRINTYWNIPNFTSSVFPIRFTVVSMLLRRFYTAIRVALSSCNSSYSISWRNSFISNGDKRAPQLTNMLLAVFPVATCQGFSYHATFALHHCVACGVSYLPQSLCRAHCHRSCLESRWKPDKRCDDYIQVCRRSFMVVE